MVARMHYLIGALQDRLVVELEIAVYDIENHVCVLCMYAMHMNTMNCGLWTFDKRLRYR